MTPAASTVTLAAALLDAAEPLRPLVRQVIREIVREELTRVEMTWRWLTAEQAGELLGISAAAVRQRVQRGQLRARKLEGRVYLDVRDLDCAIREGE
jgi:DNA-directed RNA polymerase specialized sigma24 family protein